MDERKVDLWTTVIQLCLKLRKSQKLVFISLLLSVFSQYSVLGLRELGLEPWSEV